MINNFTYDELPAVLTVPDLAAFLDIGLPAAYNLARSNQLDVIRVGRTIRIPRHAVLKYLGAC